MLDTHSLYDGQVEHLVLAHGKGNVLDAALMAALRRHLQRLSRPALKLVVIEGQGRHFSFGASVPEHLPGAVDEMIPAFHDLFRDLEEVGVPTLAVVRGSCLGGGFELATWCGRVLVSPTAELGVPEVKLGVFPPIAALALRWRVGGHRATELITTGRTVDAAEALALGLADELAEDPDWRPWFEEHLLAASAVGIRHAWRAARLPIARALWDELPQLERLYLTDLMACTDPVEGLTAFVERRPPVWRHT